MLVRRREYIWLRISAGRASRGLVGVVLVDDNGKDSDVDGDMDVSCN